MGASVKAICDFVSAIFALAAAVAWFVAASHPVALPGPGMWGHDDPKSPGMVALRDQAARVLRGVRWNKVVAILTGCSALGMFLSWLLPRMLR
jgi:hypothetical protein